MDRRVRILRFYLLLAALVVATVCWPEWAVFCWPLVGIIPCPDCCVTCTIYTDLFTTDTLATNWDDRSGTWAVTGGQLETEDSAAVIVTIAETAADATGVNAQVTATCPGTSDKARLILGWVDDNTYWFAEVQPGATDGTLKLFQRSGGADTQRGDTATVAGYTANNPITFTLCLGGGFVIATVDLGSGNVVSIPYAAVATVASTQGGVGADSASAAVKFDDFVMYKHNVDVQGCGSCAGGCTLCIGSDGLATVLVQHVVTGCTDQGFDCSELNGTYILSRSGNCAWELDIAPPITAYNYNAASFLYGGSGGSTLVWSNGVANDEAAITATGVQNNCLTWEDEGPLNNWTSVNSACIFSGGTSLLTKV